MVQSRTIIPPKSSTTIELGTFTIDIDITMMDRLVALLWSGPLYKTTGSTYNSFNNMYGSLATGKSAVSRTIIGICLPDLPFIVFLQIFNSNLLTLPVTIVGEDKIKWNFYCHTSLWCRKKYYVGLKCLRKAPQRRVKIKIKVNFYFNTTLLKYTGRQVLINYFGCELFLDRLIIKLL